MKTKKQTVVLATLVATGALLTLAFLLVKNWVDEERFGQEPLFDDPEDETERKDLLEHQPKDKSQTGMLSGFGTARMDDDAAVNVHAQLPHK